MNPKPSFRGAGIAREPGTHFLEAGVHGFRTRRCAAPRNDTGHCGFECLTRIKWSHSLLRQIAKPGTTQSRFLRVITLADGETVHNAFFDRDFREEEP